MNSFYCKSNTFFLICTTFYRFEDDGSQSELDEEIILPKMARVIQANITSKYS